MINAIVSAVVRRTDGSGDFAFAKSMTLVSPDNLDGSVMFYLKPPFWLRAERPQVGQPVLIGEVKRVMKPDWQRPRWRAFAVTPVPESLPVTRRHPGTQSVVVVRRTAPTLWTRLRDFVRIGKTTSLRKAGAT